MTIGFNVPQDNSNDFEKLYYEEIAQSRQHIPEPPSMPDTVPITEPVAIPQRRSLTTAMINGNLVIVTQGINNDDFTLFPIGNPINTSGRDGSKETLPPIDHSRYDPYNGQTSTMFGDKTSTFMIGGCIIVLTMIITIAFMGSGKQPTPVPIPYQPTPYSIETEKCIPGGFLWTGKECKTTVERGIR